MILLLPQLICPKNIYDSTNTTINNLAKKIDNSTINNISDFA